MTQGDGIIGPEDIADLQNVMNGIEAMWNSMVDSAGQVRTRAIAMGFGPEAADQIGLLAFNHVLTLTGRDLGREE